MILSFQLTMPNNNAWNGKWTGMGDQYFMFRTIQKKTAKKLEFKANDNPKIYRNLTMGIDYYYNFGDGWGANVEVKEISSAEKQRLFKTSKGFSGYDWMIDSILKYSEIRNH